MNRVNFSRRNFVKTAGLGIASLVAANTSLSQAAARKKPNFIIIFTDDQGYQDVGCFGSPDIDTPHLDRMAKEGMKFTDFYSAASVCGPSRAGLLTGRYPVRANNGKEFKNVFPRHDHGLDTQETTIAEMLKTAGYLSACIGKWHLGHRPKFLPTNRGFDRYYGIPYSNDMKGGNHRGMDFADDIKWRKGASPDNIKVKKGWVPLMRDEKVIEFPCDQKTLTRRYTLKALDFISDNKDRPFFLYLPYTMPHVPIHVSAEFRGTSEGDLYGDAIEEIDWGVGRIIGKLEKLGIDDNTLIVFTSDNGPWLRSGPFGGVVGKNEEGCALPLRGGKFSDYEGGFRVPTLMRWTGKIPAGTVCSEVASTIDLLPTLASLSGAPLPERKIDGKNIWPLMTGSENARSQHEAFYYYSGERLSAIRSGKWKLRRDELYNLEEDIGETKDVSGERTEIVDRLRKMRDNFDKELKSNASK